MSNLIHGGYRYVLALAIAFSVALPVHAIERITYYHLDALGSPVAATDEAGQVLWREDYRPYGERLDKEDAARGNERWYSGKEHDDETGLSYFGARYYDPAVGRFMGADPQGFDPDNIHSFNRYAYANNNPYKFVDPDGQEALTPFTDVPPNQRAGIGTFLTAGVIFSPLGLLASTPTAAIAVSEIAAGEVGMSFGALSGAALVTNSVPKRLARIVDARFGNSPRLGGPGVDDVFVTAAKDVAGITDSRNLAKRLTLLDNAGKQRSGPFTIIEFDTPSSGLASPILRPNPGFVQGGRTTGGAREFVMPNRRAGDLSGVVRRTVK